MGSALPLPFKSALVTGASGFIGSALVRRLQAMGVAVTGVAKDEREGLNADIAWCVGDLTRYDTAARIFDEAEPDVIFHLAGAVTGSREPEMVLPIFHANLTATVNMLSLAQSRGCQRIVLTGSLEEPDGENSVSPSPYAAAKWAGSGYARMFQALYDTPVVSARLFMVYGPDQKDVNKLVPYVIRSLLRNETPSLSSGVREIDWIYVEDVIDGYLALATAGKAVEGRSIDIGSGRLVSIRGVVEEIGSLMGANVEFQWGSLGDRPLERVCTADVDATSRFVDWRPTTPLREGLQQTIEWYRHNSP